MKKFCLLILILAAIGCTKNEKETMSPLNSQMINYLLGTVNQVNLDNAKRLQLNAKIHSLIDARENDSLTRDYSFRLAQSYFNNNEDQNYLKICRDINKKSSKANDLTGLTRSNYFIATYHYVNYNTDSAYYYYSKAEKNSLKVKNLPYYGAILFSKANLLSLKKDFSRSEALAVKALKIALEEKNYTSVYDCYLLLGNILLGMNNHEKALEYYDKSLQASKKLKSKFRYSSLQAQSYNYLGKAHQEKGHHTKAIRCFEKALSFADFRKIDPSLYCYIINNLAYSKLKLGDVNSLSDFKETLAIADSIKNIPAQITSKEYLSEYYVFRRDFKNAIFYANEARNSAHKNKIFEDELTCLQTLAKIDLANTSSYTERFIHLTDSLQNIERTTRDKYARIEFETEEIIKEKNYVISERDYLSNQMWMITIFGLLLISILTLWYFNNLQKSRNKELQFIQEQQRQNEEIYKLMIEQHQKLEEGKLLEKRRISQDLHDGVMGRLSGIRLNLFALSKRTDLETIQKCLEQIPRLQEIEREIRSISHNLSSDHFSGNVNFMQLIKKLFSDLENHSHLKSHLDVDENIEWETVSTHIKINIYRIIQEALQNITKYADAKNINLTISQSEKGIVVTVTDDGIGFDIQKSRTGIGLKNMKSRVADLKGHFKLVSQSNAGTKIKFSVPI